MKEQRRKTRSSKRSKIELYSTVLEVIKRYPEGVRITKMSYGVGVPIDRLRDILKDLILFGLVQTLTDENGSGESVFYGLTPRAFEFLETYWRMKGFLEVFGHAVETDF
jgi:predicted transcriptional regulator